MTDEQSNRWSWATTLLCAAYVAWICYVIATRAPAFASVFLGIGGEIPLATRFILALAKGPIYIVGLVLIAGGLVRSQGLRPGSLFERSYPLCERSKRRVERSQAVSSVRHPLLSVRKRVSYARRRFSSIRSRL